MTQNLTRLVLASVIATSALSACSKSDSGKGGNPDDISIPSVPNQMVIHSGVSSDRAQALNESISSIYTVTPSNSSDASVQLQQIMRTESLDPRSMQNWLEARVKYVINTDYSFDSNLSIVSSRFIYPEANTFPPILHVSQNDSTDNARKLLGYGKHANLMASLTDQLTNRSSVFVQESSGDDDTSTIMTNIGAALYLGGKKERVLLGLGFDGTVVPLTSPRTGLLKIGAGMFQKVDVQNIALDIFRAGTLFHEARHSDGHGETAGFLHAKCASGDYAGMNACDASTNGPYTVGALVQKTMMDNCSSCNAKSMEFLRIVYADISDRVLTYDYDSESDSRTPVGRDWDDTPEGSRQN